ncbi:MAG: ABC transporter substrate-binding protein [Acidobacteria bacterium]|nr:ABC transporter substrate-binding protein [Acidobacteriota bacterium]
MRASAAALAAAVFAVLPAGCSRPTPSPPGIIRVAIVSSPNNLDPRIGTDEVSQRVHQLIYDQLFRIDDQLRVAPGLATGWTQPDATTYMVQLRRGVRFHDGHELTSADVAYTFNSFLDPAFASPRKGAYRLLKSVRAVDRYVVEFVLQEPFGSFPVNLVMPIVPDGAGSALKNQPIGTGPYRFVRHVADDYVELAAFDAYFEGAPRNKGLLLRVVPDDMMRGLELQQGSADLVVNDLAPDLVHQFRSSPTLRVVTSAGTDYAYVGINLRDPVLRDRRVRQALCHAIDRQAIVDYLRRGLALPASGVLPPMSWAFEPGVRQYGFDPARAMALLDEAGYRDPDGDGPRSRLALTLKVSSTEFNRLQSSVIQESLRRVGIALDVRSYEFATLYSDVLRGNFQLFTLQWVGVSDPDMLRRVFHSKQMPPIGFNRGFFSNAAVDDLIDRATRSIDDTERRELYGDVQRLVAEEAPYVSLWYKTNAVVAQSNLQGIDIGPAADFRFLRNVWRGASNPPAR